MPKTKQCALSKEIKTESFRTINGTTKGKAKKGGCFELNIGDSLCTKCYTSKVQWDRNIKYQRYKLDTSQESYIPITKKSRKEFLWKLANDLTIAFNLESSLIHEFFKKVKK